MMNILEWGRNVGARVYDFLLRVANSIISLFRWKTDTKGKEPEGVESAELDQVYQSSEEEDLVYQSPEEEDLVYQSPEEEDLVYQSPEEERQSEFEAYELRYGKDTPECQEAKDKYDKLVKYNQDMTENIGDAEAQRHISLAYYKDLHGEDSFEYKLVEKKYKSMDNIRKML